MDCQCSDRCTELSTHKRGGGYIEVECYCERHALEAAAKYGDKELPTPLVTSGWETDGCLDTHAGVMRNRRRCQWVNGGV